MEQLKNKNVLLLGATGGIGSNLLKLLTNSGAYVWIAGRQLDKLQTLSQEYQVPSERILQVDLADAHSVQLFIEKLPSMSFDIFINAAGIGIIASGRNAIVFSGKCFKHFWNRKIYSA